MPVIGVPAEACGADEYERLVPGSRVEYRGAPWKVVGMYFAADAGAPNDDRAGAPSPGRKRTKYLILQSLDLAAGSLYRLDPSR